MKILFSLDKYSGRAGGADRLARGVVDALAAAGHAVRVVETGPEARERNENGITIVAHRLARPRGIRDNEVTMLRWNAAWEWIIDAEISSWQPDLLLTQNLLAPASVAAARRAGVRNVIFFHGYRCLSPSFFRNDDPLSCAPLSLWNAPLRHKLKWPLTAEVMSRYREAYTQADLVIANSQFVVRVVRRFFHRDAQMLHPLVDLSAPPSAPSVSPQGYILFVKPQAIKGVEMVIRIARRLRERRFVVAGAASGRIRRRLRRAGNIDPRGWVDDMDEVYRGAALLLGPARIPEPFGRVFVEAARHGVPCVATDTGGIPEAAGGGGIFVNPEAPLAAWVEAVRAALAPERHAELSISAHEHARRLIATHNREKLLELLGCG